MELRRPWKPLVAMGPLMLGGAAPLVGTYVSAASYGIQTQPYWLV
jgi:hypothetical protein